MLLFGLKFGEKNNIVIVDNTASAMDLVVK